MTPLRDDLLAALREHGPMPAADAAACVGTSAKIATVALQAMVEAGTVRRAKHIRSTTTGRSGASFAAVQQEGSAP